MKLLGIVGCLVMLWVGGVISAIITYGMATIGGFLWDHIVAFFNYLF